MRKFMLFLLTICLIIIDQVSKIYFVNTFVHEGTSIPVIPGFLSWTLAYNYGAAFSFLANHSGWQRWFFVVIAVGVSIFLCRLIIKLKYYEKWLGYSLAFILAGAIGNVIDRIYAGRVTDFIHVYYHNYHFPVFNFADICICIGVALMLLSGFMDKSSNMIK